MQFISPAKINLNLKILSRREDGYHILDSIFAQLIDLHDEIDVELLPNPVFVNNSITKSLDLDECKVSYNIPFHQKNSDDDGNLNAKYTITSDNNLALQALRLLRKHYPQLDQYKIRLKINKNIPIAAGLGGGSSNAATVLRAVNQLANLKIPKMQLLELALALGADVPYFLDIDHKAARIGGIGEKINYFEDNQCQQKYVLLINPKIHISTELVFRNFQFQHDLQDYDNHLLPTVLKLYPIVGEVLDFLKSLKPRPEMIGLSGTGATCFAVYDNYDEMKEIYDNIQKQEQSFWVYKSTIYIP